MGYAVDDGEPTWLDVVSGEGRTFEVQVDARHEENGSRWAFYEQMNLKQAPQDCYTGGGIGAVSLQIVATP